MKKTGKCLLAAAVILLAAALALGGVFFTQRRRFMESPLSMGAQRQIQLERQSDGAVYMDWPGENGEDRYYLEVRRAGQAEGAPVFTALCSESQCLLPASLPQEEALEICIFARSTWEMLGRREVRLCDDPIILTCLLACPAAEDLSVTCDVPSSTAVLTWRGREADSYRLYFRRNEEEAQLLRELKGESALLRIGDSGDLPMPLRGETYTFWLEAYREEAGVRYPGVLSEEAAFTRRVLRSGKRSRTLSPGTDSTTGLK